MQRLELDERPPIPYSSLSHAAKLQFTACERQPFLLADWVEALFVHYQIDPNLLQAVVPFELDLRDGCAFVSLVAFTMRRLRPSVCERAGEWLLRPISDHHLLNLRTYVRAGDERGIHFISKWIDNALSLPLGPPLFGLPYRFGNFRVGQGERGVRGRVTARGLTIKWHGELPASANLQSTAAGSIDEFLLERYIALTSFAGVRRFFRIWHEPWRQTEAKLTIEEDSLFLSAGYWAQSAQIHSANYSPGAFRVWMGRPHLLRTNYVRRP